MIYALDTDTYSLLTRGHAKVTERYRDIVENTSDEVTLPVMVWVEVLRGRFGSIQSASDESELMKSFERLNKSLEDMGNFRLLSVSERAAKTFDVLKTDRFILKNKMKQADLIIACICFDHGVTLVTRNTKDFEGVKVLKVENWAD